jgi:hypothetical protein
MRGYFAGNLTTLCNKPVKIKQYYSDDAVLPILTPCILVSRFRRFSEAFASTDQSTWSQKLEEKYHHPHSRENLKSHFYSAPSTDLDIAARRSELCW